MVYPQLLNTLNYGDNKLDMRNIVITFICLHSFIWTDVEGQIYKGIYSNHSETHGRFTNSLSLNCDYSFMLNFKCDFFDDFYYGSWTRLADTLIFTIDSCKAGVSIYENTFKLLIQEGTLIEPVWTDQMVKKLSGYLDSLSRKNNKKNTFKKSDLYPQTTLTKSINKLAKTRKDKKLLKESSAYQSPLWNSKKRFMGLIHVFHCAL